jgi:hypothetical protein
MSEPRGRVRGGWRAVAGGVLAATVLVGACANGSDDDTASVSATTAGAAVTPAGDTGGAVSATTSAATSSGASATTAAGTATTIASGGDASTEATTPATAPGSTGAPVTPAVLDPSAYGRDVIYTATIAVEVDDVAGAASRALTAVIAGNGILFGQHTVSDPEPRTELTFKVPPTAFQATLDALAGLGRLVDQTVGADDVTAAVVDLESQIRTAEVSVIRLRSLLDEATDVPTIVGLENELRNRETDLERLRGQLRTIQDQVALATITLTITRTPVPVPTAAFTVQQSLAAGAGAECPEPKRGAFSLTVDEGDTATVCYVVTNRGDTALADVTLVDDALGLDTEALAVVEGDLDSPLAPGKRLVLAGETVVSADVRSTPVVTAVPVDAAGTALGTPVRETATARLEIEDEGPRFGDALGGSARALVWVGVALALLVAVLLPFAWVPILGAVIVRWSRRRRARRDAATPPAAAPPPPAAEPEREREPVS